MKFCFKGFIDGESFGISLCDIQGIWDDVDEYTRGYYRNGYYERECEVMFFLKGYRCPSSEDS